MIPNTYAVLRAEIVVPKKAKVKILPMFLKKCFCKIN